MFRFAHSQFLWGLFIVAALLLVVVAGRILRNRSIRRFGDPDLLAQLMPEVSNTRPVMKSMITLLALVCILFGIAGPQFGSKLREIKRKGIEIVIALDVSNSMLAEDISPNRLERAKQAISKLVERLSNDKIGLIVFAGDAYTQIPVTMDYISAKMFLAGISPEIVPKQGTAIGAAINLGMKSFSPDHAAGKVLIVITDGENHEDDAEEMARQARERGITVHTIGLGLPKGAPVPVPGTAGQKMYLRDSEGNTVITRLNEPMLTKVAAAGGGMYIRATNTNIGLNALFDEIDKMEKEELEAKIYSDYDERFQYPIGAGLLLLLLDLLLLERKNRLLRNVRLFRVRK